MSLSLNRKLNLVIPLDLNNQKIYVHSTPISREAFESNFLLISKTFSEIYKQGMAYVLSSGPRIAALMLRKAAGDDGSADILFNETRRLTNVMMPADKGWSAVPLQEVIDRNLLDEESISEAENIIVFFTLCCSMMSKADLPGLLEALSSLWSVQTVSSNCTEYCASLPTLTAPVSSGATETASLIPS